MNFGAVASGICVLARSSRWARRGWLSGLHVSPPQGPRGPQACLVLPHGAQAAVAPLSSRPWSWDLGSCCSALPVKSQRAGGWAPSLTVTGETGMAWRSQVTLTLWGFSPTSQSCWCSWAPHRSVWGWVWLPRGAWRNSLASRDKWNLWAGAETPEKGILLERVWRGPTRQAVLQLGSACHP